MLLAVTSLVLFTQRGLLCWASPISGFEARASAASGAFNVLSMNVAGLPEILNSNGESGDKTTNTMLIGQDFAKYNYGVIHVQEDFNYHATLYEYDTHPYRTATSGGVPFGSGLNTLANYPWIDFDRIKWDTCSNASESDCLTPKGFTFMRLRLDEGVYIDFINLHADAGTESGDEAARTANIKQVADYIDANSVGNAVIVFGDTNSRYTRSADNIRVFDTQNGLTDAWVQAIGGAAPAAGSDALVCPDGVPTDINCEVVDKVFFRGSKFITLASQGFYYDTARFLTTDLATLTDHNPIRIEFAWSLTSTLRQSDLYGGPHGTWFNDLPSLPSSPKASSITLRGGSRLDAISITLTSGTVFSHGGTGGTAYSLTLSSGEAITSVKLCWGQYNNQTRNFYALVTTSTGRTVSAGATTSDCATATAPSGFGVVGTYGQGGDEMDQLGFIYAQQ
ncbi:Endonuclease/exonuclease/phosphatase family protein [Ceratobasidium theobromae]|uniref:Endonuclease/exonuclease/phosphatase family protein n=1 Tax=Ceratobasidium theobromae TaxID=1582974 RepID=A0A5N5QXJ3_9AGAM|nr:Endonuclease/exonuclease/phosphatase family protein [Ceratobasidium theobromae]